jgi:arylsulfatase A-like enzyme
VTRASLARGLLAAAVCLLAGCGAPPRPPDIIVIVGDTLRADRLGSYGGDRALTPFIDSIAARATLFRNAYAASSWTNPSVASVFTSRYPSQHGVISFDSVLPESEVTLAEALREAGYVTAFFSPNGVLREDWGYGQGFSEFAEFAIPGIEQQPDHLRLPYRADYTNRHALAWLDSLKPSGAKRPPVFLYIQYMEPHSPYAPLKGALERILAGRKPPDLDEVNRFAFVGNDVAMDERVLRDLQDVYDAEVLSLDTELRRLFKGLAARGLLENAIVVVTSDHGEEFKEHGLIGHEKTLFGEVTRVPLLIALPKTSAPAEVAEVVSLVDLAPTLLSLIGWPIPPSFEGRGLLSRSGEASPPGLAYSELIVPETGGWRRFGPHQRSLVVGGSKLITGIRGETEYYDLKADPGERAPAALDEAERAALREKIEAIQQRLASRGGAREVKPIDEETRKQIRALGYDTDQEKKQD